MRKGDQEKAWWKERKNYFLKVLSLSLAFGNPAPSSEGAKRS